MMVPELFYGEFLKSIGKQTRTIFRKIKVLDKKEWDIVKIINELNDLIFDQNEIDIEVKMWREDTSYINVDKGDIIKQLLYVKNKYQNMKEHDVILNGTPRLIWNDMGRAAMDDRVPVEYTLKINH